MHPDRSAKCWDSANRHLTGHSSRAREVPFPGTPVVRLPSVSGSRVAGRLNSGVRALMDNPLTATLARQRRRLLQSYVVHVIWFVAMIATAIAHTSKAVATTSIGLALITVPPVIVYAALVHKTCRAIDPNSRTIGLIPMILMTIFLTPFESGLIVPAKNLMVSAKLLRQLRSPSRPLTSHSSRTRDAPFPG